MKVILLTELPGKGGEGDIVEVAPGYFNNYLGPQRMAILATKGNIKQLEQRRKNIAKREEVRLANANELKAALEGKEIFVPARVGEEGVLFGSVTAGMIADAVKAEADVEIDRKRLVLRQPLKTAGKHEVELSIYRDVKVNLELLVGDAAERAAAQAAEAEADVAEEAAEEAVEETAEEAAE
ncbi:50S ribosomal protein L9 [Slackia heliotrinireducens]|uniref:Large ribosomal subunit protein bL9 n=1 Tax=Slackia heliotrinireducens (strain ATCC 29202 / DSM 20476 / NCTC 11029 / RHS 1) TaxID=471855 RepID=C7N446_SLAHD|nr:50S ribosomal protein L9 [Slackia heliotrinireducens]ACV23782.1 ribosomal protein L9 [Slackia heliotrinireducens DSM 20476]VEH03433.1 50S ribosomal protein L9 [Slackia heliotrinireducens]